MLNSVEVEENVWIPLADGAQLSARMWLPRMARERPVPAILEYIPYRKRDGTRGRDEPMHGWFAAQGYAVLRVDQRGSGESDGLLCDEYLPQEQDDAVAVIAWIAAQPWCSGAVGMMGKSWGGFNALQVAARRPPALRAIITVCSTDDRYADDIHYMGGCLLNDNLWWGTIMLAYQARPPDPEIAGPAWREAWRARIEAMPFFPALWLAHQRRDAYWKQGSVCEDWGSIACPVLAVGGWVDAYTNAVPRLLAGLRVPRLGIIGPWAHVYPHDGAPGPAIGFLQEATRWWDHWLKGEATGIMEAPVLRAWLQDWTPPLGTRAATPGRWVGEHDWPSTRIVPWRLHLNGGAALREQPGAEAMLSICSPLSHGQACGEWMGTGCPGELPTDQRLDDGGALIFDTLPLEAAQDVLGAPELSLVVSADAPVAQICARLCDVAPDGSSLRVSYGVLNLAHRDSHEHPAPLMPGEAVVVRLRLNDCGHRFGPAHRIRLALATSYWPLIWPTPTRATVTVRVAGSYLDLPIRPPDPEGTSLRFEAPARASETPTTLLRPGRVRRTTEQDHVAGTVTYVTDAEGGLFGEGVQRLEETGTEVSHSLRRELTIRPDDPLSACFTLTQRYEMGREGWRIAISVETAMSADTESFHLDGMLRVKENGTVVAERRWSERIARDFM